MTESDEGHEAQSKKGPLHQPEESDLANAMARYTLSCDEMRTVRLNPRKVVPIDQYPEETQRRGSAIVRIQSTKKYVSYVLRIAAENEHYADQARQWWAWWEKMQIEPSTAGPAPLVSPSIEGVLRAAAGQRKDEASCPVQGQPDAHKGRTKMDGWEAEIRRLLEQGRSEAARDLAMEIWHGDEAFLRLAGLIHETKEERRKEEMRAMAVEAVQALAPSAGQTGGKAAEASPRSLQVDPEGLPECVSQARTQAEALRVAAVDECPSMNVDPKTEQELVAIVQARLDWSHRIKKLYGSTDRSSSYRDGLLGGFRTERSRAPGNLASSFLGVPPMDLLDVPTLYPKLATGSCLQMVADESGGLRSIPVMLESWPRIQKVMKDRIPAIRSQCVSLVDWVAERVERRYGVPPKDQQAGGGKKTKGKKREWTWDSKARLLLLQELENGNTDCLSWPINKWASQLECDRTALRKKRAPGFRRELEVRKEEWRQKRQLSE